MGTVQQYNRLLEYGTKNLIKYRPRSHTWVTLVKIGPSFDQFLHPTPE